MKSRRTDGRRPARCWSSGAPPVRSMVQEGRRLRRRHPRAFLPTYEAAAAGRLAAGSATAERRAGAGHRARPVPAQHVSRRRRAPSPPMRSRARSPSRAIARGFDQQVGAAEAAVSSICRSSTPSTSPTRSAASRCSAPPATPNCLKWAELHADIIRRFGRFPHRNAALGRTTTPEEQAFLDDGGFAG